MKKLFLIMSMLFFLPFVMGLTPKLSYMGYGLKNATDSTYYNGNYSVTTKVYYVASGGSAQLTQTNASIMIYNGTYANILNAVGSLDYTQDLFIEATIGADVITPRLEVTAVPQSMYSILTNNSNYLGGLISTGYQRVLNNCSAGSSIRTVNQDGTVTCETDSEGYNSLSDLQGAVSNDFHNLGGTDIDTDTDTNITSFSFTGTTTKTLTIAQDGKANLTASFTDIDTNTDTFNSTEDILAVFLPYGFFNSFENITAFVNASCDARDDVGGTGAITFWVDAGTYMYPNSSYASNVEIYGYIKANDWSNASSFINASCDARDTDTFNNSQQMIDATRNSYVNVTFPIWNNNLNITAFVNASCDARDDVGYNSLSDLQGAVSNDFHNLGGTDIDTDTDTNITSFSFTGTTTKTLTIAQDGKANLTASFTDIDTNTDTFNTTAEMRTAVNNTAGYQINFTNTAIKNGANTWKFYVNSTGSLIIEKE